jgi:hypothetical protein
MKLNELFPLLKEAGVSIPAVKDLPPIDPVDLADTLNKVKQSNEYKEILSKTFDISSAIKLKNGTLTFKLKNGTMDYSIYSNGQIRAQAAHADRATKMNSPIPVPNLYVRYINCLKKLKDIAEKKLAKKEENKTIILSGEMGPDLTQIEFPKDTIYLNVLKSSIRSLKGCPPTIEHLMISDNENLISLEGCPSKLTNLAIWDNKNLSSLEHIASDIDGNLQIYRNAKITSFDNLDKLVKRIGIMLQFDPTIKSGVLSILKIKGLEQGVRQTKPPQEVDLILGKILTKHIFAGRNRIACQRDLIENDLDEYAEF